MNKDQFVYDAQVQKYNRDATIRALENKLDLLKEIKAIVYAEGQLDKVEHDRQNTLLEFRKRLESCDLQIVEHVKLMTKMKEMNGYVARSRTESKALLPRPAKVKRSKSMGRKISVDKSMGRKISVDKQFTDKHFTDKQFETETEETADKSDTPTADKSDTPTADKSDTPTADKSDTPTADKSDTPTADKSDTPSIPHKPYRKNRYPTPRYPINLTELRKVAQVILEAKILEETHGPMYSWVNDSFFLNKLEKMTTDDNAMLPPSEELNVEIENAEKELRRARCCC
jgi:hypothetical protein